MVPPETFNALGRGQAACVFRMACPFKQSRWGEKKKIVFRGLTFKCTDIKLYWNRVIFLVIFTRVMSVLQRLN